MQAIGYCRISKQEEIDDKEYYILSQKHKIREYCKENKIDIIQFYTDMGVSADELNRPALNSILALNAEESPFKYIVVESSGVISIDKNVYFTIKAFLHNIGFTLISVEEHSSNDDFANEKLIAKTVSLVDKLECQRLSYLQPQDVDEGRKIKAFKGGYSGGKVPFGYKLHNGEYKIEPREAEIVRFVFQCRGNGMTLQAIADECEKTGRKNRKGGKFYPSSIRNILENKKTYEGYYHYKGLDDGNTWVKGKQEPILDEGKS